jgi:hypothetical protein
MMVFDLVLCFSFDVFFFFFDYVLGVFEEINPRKRKLVWYALYVEKVEFDFLRYPEFHAFRYVNVGVFCLA